MAKTWLAGAAALALISGPAFAQSSTSTTTETQTQTRSSGMPAASGSSSAKVEKKARSRSSARTATPDGTFTTYQLNNWQIQNMDRGWVPPTANDMASMNRSRTTTSTTRR